MTTHTRNKKMRICNNNHINPRPINLTKQEIKLINGVLIDFEKEHLLHVTDKKRIASILKKLDIF